MEVPSPSTRQTIIMIMNYDHNDLFGGYLYDKITNHFLHDADADADAVQKKTVLSVQCTVRRIYVTLLC